ncbi:MAG: hypothetical protein MHM6MM_007745 [Cercozoa sp. M6MM]
MHETGDVRYTRRYAVAQCVAVLFVCATLLVTHRSLHVQQPKLPHEPRAALPLQQEPLQHEPSSYRVCHFARTELRSSAFTATFRDYAVRFLCGILNRPDEQRELFYAGWSVGQTIVASADIVHAGYLKEPHNYGLLGIWGHTHLLHRVRDRVLIKEQPTFFSTVDEEKLQEFLDIDSFNAELTGVKMIHKRGLGLYMATPLSSHFPWKRLDSLPVCDEQQQAKVKETVARFGYDSGRIDLNRALGEAQDGVRIMDACLSNTHFVRSQHKQFRLFRAHNSSCSELDGVSIPVADDWWARRGEHAM